MKSFSVSKKSPLHCSVQAQWIASYLKNVSLFCFLYLAENCDCGCNDHDHGSMQRRVLRREENEMNFQISAEELLQLGKALSDERSTKPRLESTTTAGVKAADPTGPWKVNDVFSGSNDDQAELPVDLIMAALSDIKTDMKELKSDVRKLIAGQKALRQSVTYIYSKMSQRSVARSQPTTPVISTQIITNPVISTPIVSNPIISTPIFSVISNPVMSNRIISTPINSNLINPYIPTPSSSIQASHSGTSSASQSLTAEAIPPRYVIIAENTYLLGGVEGFPRNLSDYKRALKKVISRAAGKAETMGRLLCSLLVKMEFSEIELSQKNVSGKTRDPVTKKLLTIPRLNPKILDAIFRQAKLQFPDFIDSANDTGCPTVRLVNDSCKHIRRRLMLQQQLL